MITKTRQVIAETAAANGWTTRFDCVLDADVIWNRGGETIIASFSRKSGALTEVLYVGGTFRQEGGSHGSPDRAARVIERLAS